MSWEKDPLTGQMRWIEQKEPVYEFRTLTTEEALKEAEPALRAMRIEREREDCLLRFGIRRPR